MGCLSVERKVLDKLTIELEIGSRSGKPWPVKCTHSLQPTRAQDVGECTETVFWRHGGKSNTGELAHGFLVARCHADMSPSSPLHAHGRQTRMSIVASKGVQYCVGGRVVGLPTGSQLRDDR